MNKLWRNVLFGASVISMPLFPKFANAQSKPHSEKNLTRSEKLKVQRGSILGKIENETENSITYDFDISKKAQEIIKGAGDAEVYSSNPHFKVWFDDDTSKVNVEIPRKYIKNWGVNFAVGIKAKRDVNVCEPGKDNFGNKATPIISYWIKGKNINLQAEESEAPIININNYFNTNTTTNNYNQGSHKKKSKLEKKTNHGFFIEANASEVLNKEGNLFKGEFGYNLSKNFGFGLKLSANTVKENKAYSKIVWGKSPVDSKNGLQDFSYKSIAQNFRNKNPIELEAMAHYMNGSIEFEAGVGLAEQLAIREMITSQYTGTGVENNGNFEILNKDYSCNAPKKDLKKSIATVVSGAVKYFPFSGKVLKDFYINAGVQAVFNKTKDYLKRNPLRRGVIEASAGAGVKIPLYHEK